MNKGNILLIEDDKDLQPLIEELVSEYFPLYTFIFQNNPLGAIEMVRKQDFLLIISDYNMPGLNGFELKEKLNEMHIADKTPFVILGACVLDLNMKKGSLIGVEGFYEKASSYDGIKDVFSEIIKHHLN